MDAIWAVVLALRVNGLQLRDSAGLHSHTPIYDTLRVTPASPLSPPIRGMGTQTA